MRSTTPAALFLSWLGASCAADPGPLPYVYLEMLLTGEAAAEGAELVMTVESDASNIAFESDTGTIVVAPAGSLAFVPEACGETVCPLAIRRLSLTAPVFALEGQRFDDTRVELASEAVGTLDTDDVFIFGRAAVTLEAKGTVDEEPCASEYASEDDLPGTLDVDTGHVTLLWRTRRR